MKNVKILAIFCVAVLVSAFETAWAQASSYGSGNTWVTEVSVDGKQFFLPCTGETVTMQGNVVVVTSVQSNGKHVMTQVLTNPHGVTGTSTNGNHYIGTGNGHWQTIISETGQSVIRDVENFGLIGPGNIVNIVGHMVYQMTINADGVENVEVDFLDATCH